MSSSNIGEVTPEKFVMMAEVAGLGLTQEELDDLKPLYDLHKQYADLLHAIDYGAEEMALAYEPEWPS